MNEEVLEDELINKIAEKIVDAKLDSIVIFFLSIFASTGRVWSQLARIYLQPLLILLNPYGEFFLNILRDPAKVEKLINRIEALKEKEYGKKK